MPDKVKLKPELPGYVGTGLLILTTSLWTFWGIAEMYYEGWGMPFPAPLAYLIPAALCLTLTLVTLTWPRLGGWVIILFGTAFTAWWWVLAARRGLLTLRWILTSFPVSGLLALTGALFLLEGRHRERLRLANWRPPEKWLLRNLRYLLAVGVPLLVILGVSISQLPRILTRVDDGDRGVRLIQGNAVVLVWAPLGPGWNWKQPWGGYPSWKSLALYGAPPLDPDSKPEYDTYLPTATDMHATGLCRYLSLDGTTLMDTPQDIWRMPTTDEVVRSFALHDENAGCLWHGELGKLDCDLTPDKETPLWAPDMEPIYYWVADEYNEVEAYYISYNGYVGAQPKDWGNPRHGYRCVREP